MTNAVDPTGSLNEANNGPWQIKVYDYSGVLKILAFAQNVSGYQYTNLISGWNLAPFLVAFRAKSPSDFCRVGGLAGYSYQACDP